MKSATRSIVAFFGAIAVSFSLFVIIQAEATDDLVHGCERGNIARQQELKQYDAGITASTQRIAAWKSRPHDSAAFRAADEAQIRANRIERRSLAEAERSYVDASVSVSKHPHANDLHKRAIVDCSVAYPARVIP